MISKFKEKHRNRVCQLMVDFVNYHKDLDRAEHISLTDELIEKSIDYLADKKVFVYLLRKKVVGFIVCELHIRDFPWSDKYLAGTIVHLFVDNLSGKSGIGTKLLNHANDHLTSIGCEYIDVEVWNENPANAFYIKAGMIPFSNIYVAYP